MRKRYHLPSSPPAPADSAPDETLRILRVVFAAIRRAVEASEVGPPEIAGDGGLLAGIVKRVPRAAIPVQWPVPSSPGQGPAVPPAPATKAAPVPSPLRRPAASQARPARPVQTLSRVAAKSTPAGWRVRIEVGFHLTPRSFFDIRDGIEDRPDEPDEGDPRDLYFPLLETPRPAVAWVVEALREYDAHALAEEVTRSFAARYGGDEIAWGFFGWRAVRRLVADADADGVIARRIPEFEATGYAEVRDRRTILRPGAWVLVVFLPLPLMRLAHFVEIGESWSTDLRLRDIAGLVVPEVFAGELGLTWADAERGNGDSTVTLLFESFVVRRRVHERTLAALFELRRRDALAIGRLGRIVSLIAGLETLPPSIQMILTGPAIDASRAHAGSPEGGFWPAGSRGVSLAPVFAPDLKERAFEALNAPFIKGEADELQRILALKVGFWSDDRSPALVAFIRRWKGRDPKLFELLLAELDRRAAFDAFIEAVRSLPTFFYTTGPHRTVIALAADTRYALDPRIAALARYVEQLARSALRFGFSYHVDAQEIWLDEAGTKRVRAAGAGGGDRAGVVAEVDPFWSETARVYQPRPEILDRLREPTRKKVGALMARMICGADETMTKEQLLQQAMQEAAKELALEEKDFVKVTMRSSIRVLKIERRVVEGLEEIHVEFQEVRKIGRDPWEPVGDSEVRDAFGFEARLQTYLVEHEMEALTTFALAEGVVLGGMVVLELEVASLGTLTLFVGLRVVLYRFTTDEEDRSLDGYLLAALQGELDAVGFKLVSGLAKGAGQLVAGRLLSSELVSQAATKWIVFALRGTITATGIGATEVVSQLGEDLVLFSNCHGWSNPGTYWNRFKFGFVVTLAMEFVAIPFLAPPLRLALERASGAVEAARALRASGKSFQEIATLLLRGTEQVEAALGRTIERADAAAAITRSFRQRIAEIVNALSREYESRAYAALLDLYGPELSAEAARGLRRLVDRASAAEIDRLLQRLLQRHVPVSDLLRALGNLDEVALAELARIGELPALGSSPRVLALLLGDEAVAARLLAGPFRFSVSELERYLGRLETLSPEVRGRVLRALAQDPLLSPDRLLEAARQPGVAGQAPPAAKAPTSAAPAPGAPPAAPAAEPDLEDLRKAARTDPRAADELWARYQRMSDMEIFRRFADDGDETAAAIIRQRYPSNEAALRKILASDYRPPHSATATLRRGGKEVLRQPFQSGGLSPMTPEERALGFPKSVLATHTEARAVRQIDVQAGDFLEIIGQYDPCSSCIRAMQEAATRTKATIRYWWPGGARVFKP